MSEPTVWTARIRVNVADPRLAERLERTMWPEAEREVPRARAELRRPREDTVELVLVAGDSGAARAALNTYLGWIQLALDAAHAAVGTGRSAQGSLD